MNQDMHFINFNFFLIFNTRNYLHVVMVAYLTFFCSGGRIFGEKLRKNLFLQTFFFLSIKIFSFNTIINSSLVYNIFTLTIHKSLGPVCRSNIWLKLA